MRKKARIQSQGSLAESLRSPKPTSLMQKPRLREERGRVWDTEPGRRPPGPPSSELPTTSVCELTLLLTSRVTSYLHTYLPVLIQHEA